MAIDAFLKLDGIEGESRDEGHVNEIDVLSYSFSASNAVAVTDGGAASGRVAFTDLNFLTYQSRATPLLLQHVANGKVIPSALLSLRRVGEKVADEFWTVELSDVLVTAVHESASGGDDRPTDSFSLAFAKIEWSYKAQKLDGTYTAIEGGWNLRDNKTT